MAAITKIEFWKDVGFLEGAIEIPSLSATDPINPDLTIEPQYPVMPSKERFFSKLKIREYYEELMEMSYIRLTYELNTSPNTSSTKIFYGWVREVSLESDGDLPVTVIDWHIDEWRTWKSSVAFGSGHVKRRPFVDIDTTPIQNYPIRYVKLSNSEESIFDPYVGKDGMKVWWIIASVNKASQIRTYFYPVFMNLSNGGGATRCYFRISEGGTVKNADGISISSIYYGNFDEFISNVIGVAPEAINGVWLSPICPFVDETQITGTGDSASPLILGSVNPEGETGSQGGVARLGTAQKEIRRIKTFVNPLTSTEETRYVLVSTDGVKLLDLPYGFTVSSVTITLVIEPDGPYFEISFKDSTYGNLEGLTVNVPLLSFPVNTNAFNSYVYSGQREYDRQMRTVRSNADVWKSSASGGSTGALFGAVGPVGALAGSAAGMTPGLVSYGVEMLYENDKQQELSDRLQAAQPSTMILSGNALISYLREYSFVIKSIVPDDYSAAQITATRNQFGVSVDELMTSCDALIRTTSPTGYYNIQNLIVGGDIPVSAKRWIKQKFQTGVRLI